MGFNPYADVKKKAEASGTTIEQSIAAKNAARQDSSRSKNNNVGQSRGKSNSTNRNNNNKKGSSTNNANKKPTGTPKAPYNFVPLNDVVVTAPLAEAMHGVEAQQTYKQFLTGPEKKYSGYFEVEVENITPLFINNGKDSFFRDGKNFLIPGSSLRGVIKNYFKIITNGTLRTGDDGDVTDKYLYYRTFASPFKPLRNAYAAEMTAPNDEGINVPCSVGGFLVREGKEYFICPAMFKRIKDEYKAQHTFNVIEWKNAEVNVFTGNMRGKKHYYQFTGAQWSKKLVIPETILLSYFTDKNAKGLRLLDENGRPVTKLGRSGQDSLKILKGADAYDFVVPCFYVADGNTVRHFGSGPLYRIPYKKSIGAHIPAKLNSGAVDFTAAIFGNKDNWSSRVFFENLYLKDDEKPRFEDKSKAIPLLGANPTSFQNYLEPQNSNASFWNTDAHIRGYKLYWHKKCDWRKDPNDSNQNENVTKTIAPLKEGHTFIGRVRFENLTAAELGALAQVLSLGDDRQAAYKLGMGKSIGMGSVRVQAKLYLQGDTYYTSLFTATGFDNGLVAEEKQQYINIFQEYMHRKLQGSSAKLYEERMQELALIMDERHLTEPDWAKKTAYMSIGSKEDKDLANYRIPLPSIKEVVKS